MSLTTINNQRHMVTQSMNMQNRSFNQNNAVCWGKHQTMAIWLKPIWFHWAPQISAYFSINFCNSNTNNSSQDLFLCCLLFDTIPYWLAVCPIAYFIIWTTVFSHFLLHSIRYVTEVPLHWPQIQNVVIMCSFWMVKKRVNDLRKTVVLAVRNFGASVIVGRPR